MATPRVKRPFAGSASDPSQRQITSFFDRSNDSDSSSPTDRPTYERRSSTPLLPPSVQANLLAVGMRVRKSVPEGYKTGKEEMEGSPVATPRRVMAAPTPGISYSSPSAAAPSYSPYTARPAPTQRELTPFCGLHTIGGLGVQSFGDNDDGRPMFAASLFDGSDDNVGNDDSEPPSLTSSQETVSSTTSTNPAYYSPPSSQQSRFSSSSRFNSFGAAAASSARKRFYGQEEDVEDEAGAAYQNSSGSSFFQVHEDARLPSSSSSSVNRWLTDGNVGSVRTSMAPPPAASSSSSSSFFQLGRRVLAVPRRRRQTKNGEQVFKQTDGQPGVRFLDQENVEIVGDFDEADFLDASMLAEGSGAHDMEMGGM